MIYHMRYIYIIIIIIIIITIIIIIHIFNNDDLLGSMYNWWNIKFVCKCILFFKTLLSSSHTLQEQVAEALGIPHRHTFQGRSQSFIPLNWTLLSQLPGILFHLVLERSLPRSPACKPSDFAALARPFHMKDEHNRKVEPSQYFVTSSCMSMKQHGINIQCT